MLCVCAVCVRVYSDFDAVHNSVGINLFFSVNISIFQAMNQKKKKEYVKKRRRSHSADSARERERKAAQSRSLSFSQERIDGDACISCPQLIPEFIGKRRLRGTKGMRANNEKVTHTHTDTHRHAYSSYCCCCCIIIKCGVT